MIYRTIMLNDIKHKLSPTQFYEKRIIYIYKNHIMKILLLLLLLGMGFLTHSQTKKDSSVLAQERLQMKILKYSRNLISHRNAKKYYKILQKTNIVQAPNPLIAKGQIKND